MSPTDLLSLNLTNLDPLTENYDLGFYLNYLMRWPSLFSSVQDRQEGIVGYSEFLSHHPSSCSNHPLMRVISHGQARRTTRLDAPF